MEAIGQEVQAITVTVLRKKVIDKVVNTIINHQYKQSVETGDTSYFSLEGMPQTVIDAFKNAVISEKTKVENSEVKASTALYVLLTINLPDGDFDEQVMEFPQRVQEFIQFLVSNHGVKFYVYAFEQRSEDVDKFKGLHCHIFMDKPTTYLKEKSRLRKAASGYFPGVAATDHCINLKYFADPTNGINYVKGLKSDSEKSDKIKVDKIMRQTYGLSPFYAADASSSCKGGDGKRIKLIVKDEQIPSSSSSYSSYSYGEYEEDPELDWMDKEAEKLIREMGK